MDFENLTPEEKTSLNAEHSEYIRADYAWSRYLIVYFYNNPNAIFNPTHVVSDNGKWYIVRPDTNERVFMGNSADECIEAINSSRSAQGLRQTQVTPTSFLIPGLLKIDGSLTDAYYGDSKPTSPSAAEVEQASAKVLDMDKRTFNANSNDVNPMPPIKLDAELPVRRSMLERIKENGGDYNPGYTDSQDEAEVKQLLVDGIIRLEKRPSKYQGLPDDTFCVLNVPDMSDTLAIFEHGKALGEEVAREYNEAFEAEELPAPKPAKLSAAQATALYHLSEGVVSLKRGQYGSWFYSNPRLRNPIEKTLTALIERKLVSLEKQEINGRRYDIASITDAGRAALAAYDAKQSK